MIGKLDNIIAIATVTKVKQFHANAQHILGRCQLISQYLVQYDIRENGGYAWFTRSKETFLHDKVHVHKLAYKRWWTMSEVQPYFYLCGGGVRKVTYKLASKLNILNISVFRAKQLCHLAQFEFFKTIFYAFICIFSVNPGWLVLPGFLFVPAPTVPPNRFLLYFIGTNKCNYFNKNGNKAAITMDS
jgi:hypothetical protein